MPNAELLTPVEVDFLWESAGLGELPYPFKIPSHGATVDERALLRRRTLEGLTARGLADGRGRPEPHVEDYFGVLAAPELSLDAIQLIAPGAQALLALAGVLGGQGLLAVQDTRGMHLQPCPADGLASAIVSLLPGGPRGTEKSITVPLEQLTSGDFLQRRGNGDERSSADEDRKALARLQAQPRLRGGQIGANARTRMGGRTRTPVLGWFDTETGRYFTQATRGHDGRDWITIAPADAATLRHRLGEMLAGAATTSAV
ncbi:ESX secretion-associated protein EspG [Amycolatopsis sp. DG1A-15b]|uniref:ESX secretion-associated protein EspG n=1 Tax=Amycolatopsis sp. DG1A-15b TaxID=3052846 RepID=UPI00255BF471|nr:ESX secretion-associated protein EspG [Amycolatopsis sp. DG1A-15b]WIX86272.1 ESX secretion-associated protein EspG [Amycolatopsis sp. DG1A-15b]